MVRFADIEGTEVEMFTQIHKTTGRIRHFEIKRLRRYCELIEHRSLRIVEFGPDDWSILADVNFRDPAVIEQVRQHAVLKRPILIIEDGQAWVLDGNHTLAVAQERGMTEVPCYVLEEPFWHPFLVTDMPPNVSAELAADLVTSKPGYDGSAPLAFVTMSGALMGRTSNRLSRCDRHHDQGSARRELHHPRAAEAYVR